MFLTLRRVSSFALYFFSAEVCAMPFVILYHICRMKAETFPEYILHNSIAVFKNGIRSTVFYPVARSQFIFLEWDGWMDGAMVRYICLELFEV